MTKFEEIVKELKKGVIPKDLQTKTELAIDVMISEHHGFSVSSLMIASARRDNFKNDKPGWVKWAEDNFDWDIPDRSHRNKFGMILLSIPEANRLDYECLFKLDQHKAQAISRFVRRENLDDIKSAEIKEVLTFLAEHNLEQMTRDEVRDAVEDKLSELSGIKKEKKPVLTVQQPELPCFKESINNIFKSLNQGSIKTFVETLTHDEAKNATSVAITCLNGVSAFSGDYKHLTVAELNELEAYTNKLCKQFGAWRAEIATTDPKAG
jgi:hypothetical protein